MSNEQRSATGGAGAGGSLPERANQTTPEQPWPVRVLSLKIEDYVDKMAPLWVEGQVVQLTRRPGSSLAFLTLRDPDVDMSLSVALQAGALDRLGTPLSDGARVVVHAKPTFWTKRGSLQLDGRAIRAVGVGELLARIEHLRRTLASEGLFDADRKRALPFLPRRIGLVCGRASAAEHDVVQNARRRWPAARFEIRQVAVQGSNAVSEVCAAIRELDRDTEVDVIVVARGGGSVEDLLPFSNEAMLRIAAACVTPLISAIGHHEDTPLLDLVADWRASTPTDAGKRVVPDLAEQHAIVHGAVARARAAVERRLATEQRSLAALRSRPVLAAPQTLITRRREELELLVDRSRLRLERRVERAGSDLAAQVGRLRALSPLATMERGYAVVQHKDGTLVRTQREVKVDELLRVRVYEGDFAVRAVGRPATS
ncbi:exodeoxyribonuclease VII large subunit [Arsenicicoccus piscis]|uniref:Exodeoxyribonuclease 7 large subunit n=1 Tax=Arsenicicoccus piscis TaxID=673954 RepID=A0ABQ6HJQ2_9MICO|nr:exodeoxyribonuclease VII large subunit [Arsenicicoccus piscis]MCH8627843.1 exodeoxyribonuclease VII large subunit [Arsenicicoccus piscis]GMA18365.1 exodeoxyribonuclease 7 large subunit [Arsenicicoccus piscis]